MRKIAIIGSPGSGKSTLAVALGRQLGLPVTHLDALYWHAGWVPTDRPTWRRQHLALCMRPHWILDGHYRSTLDIRLQHCDTVIFLDLGRWRCVARVLWRSVTSRGRVRADMAPGCPDRLDWQFLRWIWTFPRDQRPEIVQALQALPPDKQVVVLRHPREVSAFLAAAAGR